MERGKGKGSTKQEAIKLDTIKPQVAGEKANPMKDLCASHMHRYVLARTHDGWCVDGFVENVDDENVSMAVPYSSMQSWDGRAFVPHPPLGPSLYPYPYFPRRRFYRQVFPLGALHSVSLLPFY